MINIVPSTTSLLELHKLQANAMEWNMTFFVCYSWSKSHGMQAAAAAKVTVSLNCKLHLCVEIIASMLFAKKLDHEAMH